MGTEPEHAEPEGGRHRGGRSYGTAWGFIGTSGRRLVVLAGLLVSGAVAGGFGFVVAPLIRQSRDSGFWGGVTIFDALVIVAVVVSSVPHAIGLRRFRWVARLYDYLT